MDEEFKKNERDMKEGVYHVHYSYSSELYIYFLAKDVDKFFRL